MGKKLLWILLPLLYVAQLYSVTQINPQPGDSLWSIIQGWGQVVDETWPGEPTVILASDLVGDVFTISTPGIYILEDSWNVANGRIVINSDQIHLNLNGRKLACSATNQYVVTVNPGLDRVIICNGSVQHTSTPGHGVVVGAGSSSVKICNVNVEDCTNGIMLSGHEGSEYNSVADCRAVATTSSEVNKSAQGFVTTGGRGNLFKNCIVKKSESGGGAGTVATGFTLTGTEEDTKVIECLINTTTLVGDGEAYGMLLTWTMVDTDPGPPEKCILQKNIIADCGTGIIGGADAFTSKGNLAIENIAFNNNTHYTNVPNIFSYNAAGSDTTDAIENVGADA